MPPKLFGSDMNQGVRAVLLTSKALGIEVVVKDFNIYCKENIDEELSQINPDCTIPTLVDEDFISWDTHAILSHLVAKYGTDDSLYPKDSEMKNKVDQMLFMESDTLCPRVDGVIAIVVENEKEIPTEKISSLTESYKILDSILENKNFLTGDNLTVADLCCVATVSTATVITPISTEKYPNLSHWYRTCKNLDYYEETNGVGLNKLDALVELKLGRPRTKDFCA
ncbi:glutathione S-transferase 1-like isoform X2 [Anthonomus grandis grandis]|uniref:glutathione S-transferase 1-like isoform X2 n=1 Tax=Anthonomus grandis grandis TaxID=2921223 RepID=UPI00216618C8|nr:glutathione S-transferase 1-like isoform X2 [Anthonomus grandis grandis]